MIDVCSMDGKRMGILMDQKLSREIHLIMNKERWKGEPRQRWNGNTAETGFKQEGDDEIPKKQKTRIVAYQHSCRKQRHIERYW